MLLNTDISIALKNLSGCYDLKRFSIFEINKINDSFTSLGVKGYGKTISFEFKCPLCGKYHYYKYGINELIKKEIIVGGCEVLGLPLFYLGDYNKVKTIVNRHNNTTKQLYAML